MKRGEYFPIYRATQLGGRRTKPFTRPAHDSLPHHECAVKWCGHRATPESRRHGDEAPILLIADGWEYRFCSWGCLGRYSALQEIRS